MNLNRMLTLLAVMVLGIYFYSHAALLVDLNAGDLAYGTVSTWPNQGTLGGSFTASGNPTAADVSGKKAVSFDGDDSFVSAVTVPDEITGNNSYTIAVWAYNPSIANEECMVNWAKRWTASRAAQLNYGSSPSFGAVTHWDSADMGFDSGVPAAGSWHHIAVTYQGGTDSQETVYVDGERNAIEFKTLDLWPDGLFYLGCAIEGDDTTRVLYFSGSLAQVQIYDAELSAAQIKGLSDGLVLSHTNGDTTVSESGLTDTYQIALGMQPGSNVVISIANDGKAQTNVSSVTFTSSDWAIPQTVTVSAVDNSLIEGAMTSVLTHTASSSDSTFNGRSVTLNVTVLDNDRLGDLSADGTINLPDLLVMAQEWLNDCLVDDFCGGSDLTGLIGQTVNPGTVDMEDISILSQIWTQGPILITEFMAGNGNNLVTMMNGLEEDPDWIELYNAGPVDIDLNGWYLTDDMNILNKWQFPSVVIGAGRYLVVFASGQETDNYVDDQGYLHTNFNLSVDGEDLAVVEPDGTIISHYWQNYPEQVTNYSYGLELQNLKSGYFQIPTPAATNETAFDGFVADTIFNRDRGFYTTAFDVDITCPTSGAMIRYTIDGSEPTETNGIDYTGPIHISATTCLRARAFKANLIPTNTDTQTYLFLENFWSQSRPAGYPTATYDAGYSLDYDIDQDVIGPSNLFGDEYRNTYISDLQAIPSLSIVMDVDDMFGIEKGIYANSIQEGELWERAASVEMMDPNEGGLFQVDCAIRLQGGYSRYAFESPKHNFRFIFKRPYGPPKLNYKLFADSDVQEFDQIIVRTPCHDSWLTQQAYFRAYGLYAKDGWHREIQRQMGHASIHGQWVHLYLNGLYWGIYEMVERPNASFAASYHGGEKEQYDCVSSETLRDGTAEAWDTMNAITAGNGTYGSISNPPAYQELQQYLDVTNMADYVILNIYSAISDWPGWNYYACRKREDGAQFKFYCWDSEACLMDDRLYYNKLNEFHTGIGGVGTLYSYMISNEDFRILVADRLHKHLHNGGALTPENAASVFQAQLDRVNAALGPESARWADAWEATPLTRADWLADQAWLFSTFFPQRGEIIIGFFRDKGVYPQTNPPTFSRYSGYACAGDTLSMNNPNGTGTIYYTVDGSDPREPSHSPSAPVTLAAETAAKKVLVPNLDIGTNWTGGAEPYDDSSWTEGVLTGVTLGGVGYENGTGYEPYITYNVKSAMYSVNKTCYIRIPFTVQADDIANADIMTLRVRYDDGFAAYLNGTRIASANAPASLSWNSGSTAGHDDSVAVNFVDFDCSAYTGLLQSGSNILAIHGLNSNSTTNSDFLISVELLAEEDSGSDSISDTAVVYTAPITLSQSVNIKARILNGTEWSALTEAVIAVGPTAQNLRITELMYHPSDPNTEYVELKNIGTQTIPLNLVQFTRGIDFTFPSINLDPNQFVVVVEDQAAFAAKYSSFSGIIAGQYTGSLDNAGETIELQDALGTVIHLFEYNDGWYDITDGQGFSLTIKNPAATDMTLWNAKAGWRPSAKIDGSPGADDSGIVPEIGSIVINELLAHSHLAAPDWIELHNTTDQAINIGGWFMSDNNDNEPNLMKYQIPQDTTIPAGGYIVFYENETFNNTSAPGCHTPFSLSEGGETLYLHSGQDGVLTGYSEEESFDASESNVAFGRYYKVSTDSYNFVAMSSNTPGYANAYPKVGPIVISQIYYNPEIRTGDSYDKNEYEYVVLTNITDQAVNLWYVDTQYGVNVPWAFTDAIDYTFDQGAAIEANQSIVVVKNKTAFSERFPSVPAGKIYGPYSGKLDNAGEKLELSMPGDQEEGVRYYIRVDRVVYDDISPWPTSPDGGGDSLNRITLDEYGNDCINWEAQPVNPLE